MRSRHAVDGPRARSGGASGTRPLTGAAWLALSAIVACSQQPERQTTPTQPTNIPTAIAVQAKPSDTVGVRAGSYRSFFPGKDEPERVQVAAFDLETQPVTNGQFLRFVKANPKWRRSVAKRLFVDQNYLRHWSSDTTLAKGTANQPVTHVSWFAARAYARWIDRRLPSLQEWEYVAGASQTAADGNKDKAHTQVILDWYGKQSKNIDVVRSTPKNFFGVYDMHGLVWEWVENFNTALITGESRGDTGLERKLFCGAGSIGSANPSDYAAFMRFAFRSSLQARYTVKNLGFRCAKDSDNE